MIRKSLIAAAAVAGAALLSTAHAAPVKYEIEPSHTYPSFAAPHLGISWWRGKFNSTKGTVMLDKAGKAGTVDIVIDAKSLDFGHDKMNGHAMGADFFNVEKFPEITYSGKLVFTGDVPTAVDGQLTLMGVTKPVKLDIASFKCITHPMIKREVCGADASGSFNRADFGMTKYADGDAGMVKLAIQVEALIAQ